MNRFDTNRQARRLVIDELANRGYTVLETKNPLLVKSPSNLEFRLAVHGQRGKRDWPRHHPGMPNILAYMPCAGDAKFFILSEGEAQTLHEAYHAQYPKNEDKTGGGFGRGDHYPFEGRWCTLPK
jgi:hypothetical protein